MKKILFILFASLVVCNLFAQESDSISEFSKQFPQINLNDSSGSLIVELNDEVVVEMIKVPGGSFPVGYKKGYPNEMPVHKVTLDDFFIGKFEITQKVWFEVMGNNPAHFKDSTDGAVEMVTYFDVLDFIDELNKKTGMQFRLPTEAEWEYAANGGERGKRTRYAGSYKIDEVAWYERNSGNRTHPVGQKLPNELGVFDMSGNVYEWTEDWFKRYKSKDLLNPQGPEKGKTKVIRGGCWHDDREGCRVQCRVEMSPDDRNGCLGFRLALSQVK